MQDVFTELTKIVIGLLLVVKETLDFRPLFREEPFRRVDVGFGKEICDEVVNNGF